MVSACVRCLIVWALVRIRPGICSMSARPGGRLMQLRTGICLYPLPDRVDASATPHWYLIVGSSPFGCMLQLRTGIGLFPLPDRVGIRANPPWYWLAGCSHGWSLDETPHWYLLVSVACSGGRFCNFALVYARWLFAWVVIRTGTCLASPLAPVDAYANPPWYMFAGCSPGGRLVQLRTGFGLCPLPDRVDACAHPHWYLLTSGSPGWLSAATPHRYLLASAA